MTGAKSEAATCVLVLYILHRLETPQMTPDSEAQGNLSVVSQTAWVKALLSQDS